MGVPAYLLRFVAVAAAVVSLIALVASLESWFSLAGRGSPALRRLGSSTLPWPIASTATPQASDGAVGDVLEKPIAGIVIPEILETFYDEQDVQVQGQMDNETFDDDTIEDFEENHGEDDEEGTAAANDTLGQELFLRSVPKGGYPVIMPALSDILTPCGRTKATTKPCKSWQIKSGSWCYDVYRTNRKAAGLPVVISAPHDGRSIPYGAGWAKRESKQCTTMREGSRVKVPCKTKPDTFSTEIAIRTAKELHRLTGKYPHVLVACIARSRVDFNRKSGEAAFGKSKSEEAYRMYFNKARSMARGVKSQCSRGLWLDLHGWAPPAGTLSYTQLGYGIGRSTIDDAGAREQDYQQQSSLKPLASVLGKCGLVKGGSSLGAALTSKLVPGYSPALPSPSALPGQLRGGAAYLQAKYDGYTAKYIASEGIAAVQVEMPTKVRCKDPRGCAVRSPITEGGWTPYARHLAEGIHAFMGKNYGKIYTGTCGSPAKQKKQANYMAGRNTKICR